MIGAALVLAAGLATTSGPQPGSAPARAQTRVTILVDAFGDRPGLRKDWGYSALVEHGGKRILFDAGNDADALRRNAEALGEDLRELDFVVISHRHGDHTDGLHHLLDINPGVRIYAADDEYFGGPTPRAFFERGVDTLPARMRYFDGRVPDPLPHGSPWKRADIERIAVEREIAPGIRLVPNLSQGPAFRETPELSMAIDTADGQVVFVGCSHPGIERILASVQAKTRPVRLLVGGLHWIPLGDDEVRRLARSLRDDWRVHGIAPGHCTGEVGFAELSRVFGRRYRYAGLGTTLQP